MKWAFVTTFTPSAALTAGGLESMICFIFVTENPSLWISFASSSLTTVLRLELLSMIFHLLSHWWVYAKAFSERTSPLSLCNGIQWTNMKWTTIARRHPTIINASTATHEDMIIWRGALAIGCSTRSVGKQCHNSTAIRVSTKRSIGIRNLSQYLQNQFLHLSMQLVACMPCFEVLLPLDEDNRLPRVLLLAWSSVRRLTSSIDPYSFSITSEPLRFIPLRSLLLEHKHSRSSSSMGNRSNMGSEDDSAFIFRWVEILINIRRVPHIQTDLMVDNNDSWKKSGPKITVSISTSINTTGTKCTTLAKNSRPVAATVVFPSIPFM